MDRVGDAFVWPFRDPQWLEKVVVMGLILLIPIVGEINGLGWLLATIRRLRQGEERLPPANFDYLGKGFELFVVFLVYSLALTALAAIVFVPAIVLLSTQSGSSGNLFLELLGVVMLMLALAITIVGTLAFYFVRPAIVLATDLGGIAGGFDIPAVVRRVRVSPVYALIAGLMLIAAGFIGGLGAYACVVGIIFTIPYSLAMEAWIVRSFELGANAPPPPPREGLNVGQPAASGR